MLAAFILIGHLIGYKKENSINQINNFNIWSWYDSEKNALERLYQIIKLFIEFTYLYKVCKMLTKNFEVEVNLFLSMNKKIADL